MIISISMESVQHIKSLRFNVNLNDCKVICLTGKNGCGKTTLVRAFQNIKSSSIFRKTASPYIFCDDSKIVYEVDGLRYEYSFNNKLNDLDSKKTVPREIKNSIHVELPIPYGSRFSKFSKLTGVDEDLRKKIALNECGEPEELKTFLHNVYESDKFSDIKEVEISGDKYFFIPRANNLYIREDFFSTGEYFVINLYRMISAGKRLIVIDELDIALDSSAQVRLVREIRKYCVKYKVNVVFTSHSLALMKTLDSSELYYMECDNGEVAIENYSYNYLKSILFGFSGWDKYILVEDVISKRYLEYFLIKHFPCRCFYKYVIVFAGGAGEVVKLMGRNSREMFFSEPQNVISILDGDQREKEHYSHREDISFLPFSNVEDAIFKMFEAGELGREGESIIALGSGSNKAKNFYKQLLKEMSEAEIFDLLTEKSKSNADELVEYLSPFLSA